MLMCVCETNYHTQLKISKKVAIFTKMIATMFINIQDFNMIVTSNDNDFQIISRINNAIEKKSYVIQFIRVFISVLYSQC